MLKVQGFYFLIHNDCRSDSWCWRFVEGTSQVHLLCLSQPRGWQEELRRHHSSRDGSAWGRHRGKERNCLRPKWPLRASRCQRHLFDCLRNAVQQYRFSASMVLLWKHYMHTRRYFSGISVRQRLARSLTLFGNAVNLNNNNNNKQGKHCIALLAHNYTQKLIWINWNDT